MLTKRQQQVLKAMAKHGAGLKICSGLWLVTCDKPSLAFDERAGSARYIGASTLYALAHHGLVAFVDAAAVLPTPKGEALAALLDETTMVTRRGNGMVIS